MRGPAIPVLAFHAIERGPGPLRIRPDVFAGFVEALAEAGATAITARQAGLVLEGIDPGPPRPVVFTFDDGYRSVHHAARPILKSVGWVGTVFPVTAALGGPNTWDGASGSDLELMSAAELVDLHSMGWEVGGHTHRHPSLPRLAPEEIDEELRRADEALEALVGSAPESFAYPYGHHDETSRSMAARRYRWCWTIGAERATPTDARDSLPRIEGWYARRRQLARHLHDPIGTLWLGARRMGRTVRSRVG